MTKNKRPAKNEAKPSSFFMCPWFHDDVLAAVSGDVNSVWFNKKGRDDDCNDLYKTSVMGDFQCKNSNCSKKQWSSKKVAIVIRRYPRNGYNATVFKQRCASCNQLGALTLDKECYIERVAYRLKKWAGVVQGERVHHYERAQGPHRREFCEGCRLNKCEED